MWVLFFLPRALFCIAYCACCCVFTVSLQKHMQIVKLLKIAGTWLSFFLYLKFKFIYSFFYYFLFSQHNMQTLFVNNFLSLNCTYTYNYVEEKNCIGSTKELINFFRYYLLALNDACFARSENFTQLFSVPRLVTLFCLRVVILCFAYFLYAFVLYSYY